LFTLSTKCQKMQVTMKTMMIVMIRVEASLQTATRMIIKRKKPCLVKGEMTNKRQRKLSLLKGEMTNKRLRMPSLVKGEVAKKRQGLTHNDSPSIRDT